MGTIADLADKRAKLTAELAAVEEEIAVLHGETDPSPAPKRAPSRKAPVKKA